MSEAAALQGSEITFAGRGAAPIRPQFFARPAALVARDLIGALIFVEDVGGVIVETEAYAPDDPASHSFVGRTLRNAAMFGPPGTAYVYRSYGIHWCLNFVCGEEPGSAVLLRALEPVRGLAEMALRRGLSDARLLCSGPGRLCQALAVTSAQIGAPLDRAPFRLEARACESDVLVGRRVGISKAVERPWRFGLAGSRFLSKPMKRLDAEPTATDIVPVAAAGRRRRINGCVTTSESVEHSTSGAEGLRLRSRRGA